MVIVNSHREYDIEGLSERQIRAILSSLRECIIDTNIVMDKAKPEVEELMDRIKASLS